VFDRTTRSGWRSGTLAGGDAGPAVSRGLSFRTVFVPTAMALHRARSACTTRSDASFVILTRRPIGPATLPLRL
jgi:hypothetical protein